MINKDNVIVEVMRMDVLFSVLNFRVERIGKKIKVRMRSLTLGGLRRKIFEVAGKGTFRKL